MNPFLLSAAFLAVAALLMLAVVVREYMSRKVLAGRMNAGLDRTLVARSRRVNQVDQWVEKIDAEVPPLLDQLGWRRSGKRTLFFSVQIGIPLIACVVLVCQVFFTDGGIDELMPTLFAAGLGFLIPKRFLVAAVGRRKSRLAKEVPTLISMLRMLFEVGMTVEQALRVLMNEGKHILPEIASELRWVLARVDAGLELGAELREMAVLLDVVEVSDCVTILDQLLRQGGGAMASLLALKNLLDDRRMTTLQEKVSKLSAKMSAVMVAFLFPALLIVLAGPGFVAVFRALGDMGG
ncbi:MAG: type II secretion system F family protein [Gammaproteobacteria bacterium]|jgi:tight adherence protein C|nr:MAG: type II secretion system F family protein [Gammaproteobacteria bacterium]